VGTGIVDYLVGPHVLIYPLTGNQYRDFLLYDPPKLLEYMYHWQSEHEYGTGMMVLWLVFAII
jgi:hypothetical protein